MANGRSIPAFRFVDLFAGVGGFHHALAPLGGQCVLAAESDAECRRVYAASFPDMSERDIVSDIRGLTRAGASPESPALPRAEIRRRVPPHDVLCAGFPCQPFSKSGAQAGFRDRTRGTLFFDLMLIVEARRPQYVILENVRNLAGPRHEKTWFTIVDSLQEAGYRVSDDPVVMSPHLLSAEEGGAPQIRDRVFVLAKRASSDRLHGDTLVERAPSPGWDPHDWDIRDILDEDVSLAAYGLSLPERGWMAAWQAFVQGIEDDWLPGFPIWADHLVEVAQPQAGDPKWKVEYLEKNAAFYRSHRRFINEWRGMQWGPLGERVNDFPASRRKLEWQARRAQPTAAHRDIDSLVAHLRPSGIRLKPPSYLPALVAITQTSVLGPKVTGTEWRRLTPREAARLQGIPFEGFERAGVADKTVYRQLGNAVNVGVVQHVARALFEDGGLRTIAASGALESAAG